jgi:hypothetical protein
LETRVTLYSVFERATAPPEAPVVVPDRFSWSAAVLPPVYLVLRGLWLELIGFVLVVLLVAAIGVWLGMSAAVYIYLLLALLFGWEASALWRGALRRKGWRHSSEVIAAAPDLAQVEWLRRRTSAP